MRNRLHDLQAERLDEALKAPQRLRDEEVLFCAIHRRPALLNRLVAATACEDQRRWACAIAGAFANLLEHCDLDELCVVYQKRSLWNDSVRPPSVLEAELMFFLGALSMANAEVFALCKKRGSVQACLRLLNDQYFNEAASNDWESDIGRLHENRW